jgi:hypothetical protein
MRLAQRNAIYDRIKTRGQELKEVDQKIPPKRVDKNIRQCGQNPRHRSLARGWQLPGPDRHPNLRNRIFNERLSSRHARGRRND